MQQKRSRVVWLAVIVVAFFFIVDPFRLFTNNRMPKVRVDRETQTELAAFVSAAPAATDFMVELLRTHDVVLIGETGFAAQHATFAADLIPVLDSSGIRHFGYQYANREDQDLLDQLITDQTFDEQVARQILFNHLTIFGYQEHVEIFRSAWEVNRRKGPTEQPFRIFALSNRLDYSAIANEDDVGKPEIMQRVFASGVPDAVMAQIIADQFLDTGFKAVAFMQLEHAFTGLERPEYDDELQAIGFYGIHRAGNTLRADYGDRVVTAALHGPTQFSRSNTGFGYPTGSVVDTAVSELADGTTLGFQTASSPFADVQIIGDAITSDEGVTVSGFADAYIVTAPINRLTPLTPIEGFITDANVDQAIRNFPGADPTGATVADLNKFIAGNSENIARVFSEFK